MQVPTLSTNQLPATAPAWPVNPIPKPQTPPVIRPVVEVVQTQAIPVPQPHPYAPPQIVLQPIVNVTVANNNTSSATSHAQATAVAIAGGVGRGRSRLGWWSFVMGCLCFAGSWVPFLGIFLLPVALLGLVFGLAGFLISLVGRRSSTGLPVLGMLVNFAALVVAPMATADYQQKQQGKPGLFGQPAQVGKP